MSEITEDVLEQRHVSFTVGGLSDFHAALAWAVQRYDRHFTNGDMVKLEVEQVLECSLGEQECKTTWSASVSGSFDAGKADTGG